MCLAVFFFFPASLCASVPDPWHIGTDPDPRISRYLWLTDPAPDQPGSCSFRQWPPGRQQKIFKKKVFMRMFLSGFLERFATRFLIHWDDWVLAPTLYFDIIGSPCLLAAAFLQFNVQILVCTDSIADWITLNFAYFSLGYHCCVREILIEGKGLIAFFIRTFVVGGHKG